MNILYENQVLRNTNYYLLCTIYNLEKQKINNYHELIKKTQDIIIIDKSINDPQFELEVDYNNNNNEKIEITESKNTTIHELMNQLEEKQEEYDVLNTELQNLKIEMEVQQEFSEHKLLNLELAKNLLEQELLDKRKIILDKENSDNKINSDSNSDSNSNDKEELLQKGNEIEKLKRENAMLTINNQQLQYELIRTIKQMQ